MIKYEFSGIMATKYDGTIQALQHQTTETYTLAHLVSNLQLSMISPNLCMVSLYPGDHFGKID